jgi:hypothetical protein
MSVPVGELPDGADADETPRVHFDLVHVVLLESEACLHGSTFYSIDKMEDSEDSWRVQEETAGGLAWKDGPVNDSNLLGMVKRGAVSFFFRKRH